MRFELSHRNSILGWKFAVTRPRIFVPMLHCKGNLFFHMNMEFGHSVDFQLNYLSYIQKELTVSLKRTVSM